MSYWAKPPQGRNQLVLIPRTLDDVIAEDHPVRLFDELLRTNDWKDWENRYHGRRGQPPIHPRLMASVLLYGLSRGLRKSRQLEYVTSHNIDFMWLVEGISIDHSTLCGFRKEFRNELKGLFRQVCKIAMTMGLIRLGEVTLDATRVKANNGRYQTLTAERMEELLASLDQQMEQMLCEAEAGDAADPSLEISESSRQLPTDLAALEERKAKLQEALKLVQAADAVRAKDTRPTQLPMTDPESKVMPNKEGGFAPNYTPIAAVDTHRGFLVQVDVLADVCEHGAAVTMIDGIEQNLGSKPERALADGHYSTGQNIVEFEKRGIELFSPVKSNRPAEGNPARRDDPTQVVPPEQWDQLPRNPQTKKLDKSCFEYVESEDVYYCPQGQRLPYEQTKTEMRSGERVKIDIYRCRSCSGCPLMAACVQDSAKRGRQISRDAYEGKREALAAKMASEAGQEIYAKRFHSAEVPFAIIKHIFGLRQFLLRGLENTKTEWLWACTAFNLKKLGTEIARLRAEFARMRLTEV